MVDMTFLAEGFFGSLISAFENAQWRKVKQIKLNINNQVSFVVLLHFYQTKLDIHTQQRRKTTPVSQRCHSFKTVKGSLN